MTFSGGIHPCGDGKRLTCFNAVQTVPLLDKYQVILAQNAGNPPVPVVKKGDEVKKYQLIAKADGFVSANLHAPTSGIVSNIREIPGTMGIPAMAIEISADGKDEGAPPFEIISDWKNADPQLLKQRVIDAGLVGMGGASFPMHVKLSPPPEKKVDTLILNGAECEPYLTADHRLMLEFPEKVVRGAAILGRILGISEVVIGVEINKLNAIETLEKFTEQYGVKIATLHVRYPQGSEKQLINAITGRTVKAGT